MNKKQRTKRSVKLLFLSFMLLLLFANLAIAQDSEVKNEACLDCHDGIEETLFYTPHDLQNNKSDINCISCHSGGKTHFEDPSVENIVNPKHVSGIDALKACNSCHTPHATLDNLGFDIHQSQGLNCSSCHTVHGGKKSLLLNDNASFCMTCHDDVKQEFSRRSSHPVNQGSITCLDCHSFSKETDNNLSYDLQRACMDCHPEQGGPFLFEHEVTTSYTVGGSGCIECHSPHGSENNYLLSQPNDNLCKSCHFVPNHETAHANRDYSVENCSTCHTQTHGSFTSNLLLDPNMNTKFADNCYESGCHSQVK